MREGRSQEAEVRRQKAGKIKYVLPSCDVLRQEAELLRTSERSFLDGTSPQIPEVEAIQNPYLDLLRLRSTQVAR